MPADTPPPADRFRRLHDEGLLIVPNAWDAGTAYLTESLGAKAVATTSAGVGDGGRQSGGHVLGRQLRLRLHRHQHPEAGGAGELAGEVPG